MKYMLLALVLGGCMTPKDLSGRPIRHKDPVLLGRHESGIVVGAKRVKGTYQCTVLVDGETRLKSCSKLKLLK